MDSKTKLKLFLDADDTILESSQAIIEILNNKYNITPPKTMADLRDWGYRSIYKYLTPTDVEDLFETDEFFNIVQPDKKFLNFYNTNKDKFDIIIVTKGTKANIDKKKDYLKKIFGDDFEYVGMILARDEDGKIISQFDKSQVNMSKGIHIDDRPDALMSTNANIKVLLRRGDYYWNDLESYANINNLYTVRNWDEIAQILLFACENHFMLEK